MAISEMHSDRSSIDWYDVRVGNLCKLFEYGVKEENLKRILVFEALSEFRWLFSGVVSKGAGCDRNSKHVVPFIPNASTLGDLENG